MKSVWTKIDWPQALEVAFSVVAGGVGFAFAYDLGMRVAGLWLAVIMGVNAAVFCVLTASYLTDRIFRRKRTGRGD